MKNFKDFKNEKLKEIKEDERLQILPDGENWREYFENYLLKDNEYIVYYNINNIIYLYNKLNDTINIIGDLNDLVEPIDNTSIVAAINYVWEHGGGSGANTTDVIDTVDPDLEGGTTQQEVNEANKEAIDNINTEIMNILNGNTPITTTTDAVNTFDPISEGGTTQQEVNENNKTAIDNLNDEVETINTEINDIIDGTTSITTTTDNVITVDSELEGGDTQQEVNENNKTAIDTINSEIEDINQEITDINNNLPDLTDYYTKSEVDAMITDLQSQLDACCGGTTPTGDITNVVTTDPTEEDGDGSVSFDANVSNCSGVSYARLTPTSGTSDITLTSGDNVGLTFTDLPAGDYTIQVYCDTDLIASQAFTINPFAPPSGGLIPITPENDDDNSKANGTTDDDYDNYDIIISKNNHTDYVSNGVFIGKEIAIGDLNQSGLVSTAEVSKLTFTDLTTYNLTETGGYTGIYYLKGMNVGLTPLITSGEYTNGDVFVLLDDILNYNFIVQKWYDNTRENFTYTLWEVDASVGNDRIYTSKNAAETATNGWHYNNQKIETGIGEPSYLEIIYGFNFTEITDIVTSSTSDTFTVSDFSTYDFLSFNIKASDTYATWLLNVNDIVQDGTTKYSYANYNQDYFTILDNVITWFTEGGLGHFELMNVKGIKI